MAHGREIGTSGADQTSNAQDQPADTLSIGELVNERYSVLTRISEGPSGTLYRAHDVKTDSEVMLKLLVDSPGLDDARIRQLSQELSVTRSVTGTRSKIALVYDCNVTLDGRAFVVMEPLEGRSLAELIRWREPLSVERALRLALQIAEGLHAAHNLGLVHGALGAEHVLVQRNDTVKLMGFEVARLRTVSRAASLPPPERAEVLTAAADTKAVAMLLLEMLTSGVRPGLQGLAPDRDAPRGGEVPAPIKELVMQALVRSPGLPPQDMGALAKALSAELSHPPQNPSTRAWRRARPSPRRRQWTLIGAGVLAVVVSALGGWLTWSLVAAPRLPVTRETPAAPSPPAVSHPASSVPERTTPSPSSDDFIVRSPLPPPPVAAAESLAPKPPGDTTWPPASDAVAPPAPVKPHQAELPAPDERPSAAVKSAPVRAREVARPVPGSGSDRSESDAPDPSAIIDWLINGRGRQSERP
jgi:serine/threonine-protein kinase